MLLPRPSPCAVNFQSFPIRVWQLGVGRYASSVAKAKLPTSPARTRFAPSPTGLLHLGSLRTALYNYLLAKKTRGQFLLRVEDTDQRRTVPDAERRLYEDLRWAGLQWDEGPEVSGPYGPYKQSERTEIYQDHAHQLLQTPHAYRCFCSADRLAQLAKSRSSLGLPTDYDRACASIPADESDTRAHAGEPHVIRLRSPQSYPAFTDLVYGRIGRKGEGFNAGITHKMGEVAYEDPVLLKSDGRPTYHLANVVDDHLMKITHVVRATEWLSSTSKHLAIYRALGWEPPVFAHVGLLVGEEGRKLSKRDLATEVAKFREEGWLPEALVNFVGLLGWSHGRKRDEMNLQEMVEEFEPRFTKGNTTVTMEKLRFLQRGHASRAVKDNTSSLQTMVHAVATEARKEFGNTTDEHNNQITTADSAASKTNYPSLESLIEKLLTLDARNYISSSQFTTRNRYFFTDVPRPKALPAASNFHDSAFQTTPDDHYETMRVVSESHITLPFHCLQSLFVHLCPRVPPSSSDSWTDPSLINIMLKSIVAHRVFASDFPAVERLGSRGSSLFNVKEHQARLRKETTQAQKELYADVCKALRWVLFSGDEGPSVLESVCILGREVCLKRWDQVRELIDAQVKRTR